LRVPSRPSQVRVSNLHSMRPPHLHCKVRAVKPESIFFFSGLLDFVLFGKLVRLALPYIRFLFVGPELCLWLPSDSASRRTPLPLANTSYCQVCSGLSPPSYCPCWAHRQVHNWQDANYGRNTRQLPPLQVVYPANRHHYEKAVTGTIAQPSCALGIGVSCLPSIIPMIENIISESPGKFGPNRWS
jgi:hypothetical protein